MTPHSVEYLQSLLNELRQLPTETEWVEFKHNNADPVMIGERISALSNAAALLGKQFGYLVWGIENETHEVLGTDFVPSQTQFKQQELENWLLQKLKPKIDFQFLEFFTPDNLPMVILEIQAVRHTPVMFDGIERIRIGSYTKPLKENPEKERALWRVFDKTPFEQQIAAENLSVDAVLKMLDYPAYFDRLDLPLPEGREGVLSALISDDLVVKNAAGLYDITNLGAIAFAKDLSVFKHLTRKSLRVILYRGGGRIQTVREIAFTKGYAVDYALAIDAIMTLLPSNEEIGRAFRQEVAMYPELAIRELVANALIHQDFFMTGTGPMVELFDQRVEITNPGLPLVDTQRFLDTPPRSRNEALASLMRRLRICEERGSGIDKVVFQTELYQLPAPKFEVLPDNTRSTLFAYMDYKDMDTADKVRATYLHCCLQYVSHKPMNNTSLRERFKVEETYSSSISRVIKQAVDEGLIRLYDPKANRKVWRYVPFWA